jgi:hypothetical protein
VSSAKSRDIALIVRFALVALFMWAYEPVEQEREAGGSTLMQRATVWTGWTSPAKPTRLLPRWGDAVGGPTAGSQTRLPICGPTLLVVRLAAHMAAGESRHVSHFA